MKNVVWLGCCIFLIVLIVVLVAAINRESTKQEQHIEYRCAKSGVEYLETSKGLAVHVYEDGKPVKCDRWKGYTN